MTPLRVVHITTVDSSLRYLLLHQLLYLRACGYEVTAISAPGPHVEAVTAAGIQHTSVPMSRSLSPLPDLVSLWRLYRILREEPFAIVHTHTPKAGLVGQLAARLAGVPVVINTLHGFYFHEGMSKMSRRFYVTMEKAAALCSTSILSQSEEDIATAIEEKICDPRKIKHLGNGINLTRFDRRRFSSDDVVVKRGALGLPVNSPVVGFVGRLAAKRKGFLDFLAAAREIHARMPQTRFLIIGETDRGKRDAVEPSVACQFGVADACVFLGQLPNNEMPLLYALMNVLVLPSPFEGMPRAVMEAGAMSVPAVVTDVKGNREVVRHGVNGRLVPLGDVRSLTKAIVEVLVDPTEARAMGRRARYEAEQRFDERLVFERVAAEYHRLLLERNVNPPAPATEVKRDRSLI